MTDFWDIVYIVLAVVAVVALPIVVRRRRRSQQEFYQRFADEEVCEHLRPALELLRSRGHRVVRAGQKSTGAPLEIHISPGFDPKQVYEELKLGEPAGVSERNVLFCREDWCELHPAQGRG